LGNAGRHAEAGTTQQALCGARPDDFASDIGGVDCIRCLRSLERNACVVLGELRARIRAMRKIRKAVAIVEVAEEPTP